MPKLIAICEAFRMESTYPRWKRLSEIRPGLEVILVAPKYYEDKTWPEKRIFETKKITTESFSVIPIDIRSCRYTRNGFISLELLKLLINEKPDFLYMIGFEANNIVLQLAHTRFLWDRNCKKIAFTMRGLPFPLYSRFYRFRWSIARRFFNAICCHYPRAIDVIKNQGGFKGPVYLQTQVGVDQNVHYFSKERRENARRKFGIGSDEFIFGMACRIEDSKGIFEVLEALPKRNGYRLLVIGDGIQRVQFEQKIRDLNLEEIVIYPGFVSMGDGVAEALCSMDMFIHYPKTTETWMDTFPLAVVQAMATKRAVIGSNSGAVPYQIGNADLIVPESNPNELNKKLNYFLDNKDEAVELGIQAYERVLNTFEIEHLTKTFAIVLDDIANNFEIKAHQDQANFSIL